MIRSGCFLLLHYLLKTFNNFNEDHTLSGTQKINSTSDEDKSHEINNLRAIILRYDYHSEIFDNILLKFRDDKSKITLPEFGPETVYSLLNM